MNTCKHCGTLLVMTLSGRCRWCGSKARFGRKRKGITTTTQRAATRILKRELSAEQAILAAKRAEVAVELAAKKVEFAAARQYWRSRLEAQGATPALIAYAIGDESMWQEDESMTWQEAETYACAWMQLDGYLDARLTASGADGGIDITSGTAVAQVKHHAKPVGISEVQRLSGIAHGEAKQALFFAASGFTAAAQGWASENSVRCFVYPPVREVG